jgi:hypothetical protein
LRNLAFLAIQGLFILLSLGRGSTIAAIANNEKENIASDINGSANILVTNKHRLLTSDF